MVEHRRHSHLPSSCSLVLLFTLMLVLLFWAVLWTRSRKGSETKAWQGGQKGIFCFVFQQCCLLAENCVDTTESGEPWCGGGSYLHQLSCQHWNTVQLYPQANRALFHAGPEALQTDHAFSRVLQDVMIFCETILVGCVVLWIQALLWRDEAPNDGAAALSRTVVLAQRGRVGLAVI